MKYLIYKLQIVNNSRIHMFVNDFTNDYIINHFNITEEQIKAFFAKYCEVSGYSTINQYEAERDNTINGICDVVRAKLCGYKHNKILTRQDILKWIHDLWSYHRYQEGWNYGEKKDKVNKKNPCLKPFKYLTEKEISFDAMFLDLYNQTICY